MHDFKKCPFIEPDTFDHFHTENIVYLALEHVWETYNWFSV